MPQPGGLEFRVLGHLEALRDGEPLALSGARQRALLAALLQDVNTVVPSERLLDLVWGESAGGNALQVSISRLRRLLEREGDPPALLTRAPGYELRVAPSQLDAQRFTTLLGQARDARL